MSRHQHSGMSDIEQIVCLYYGIEEMNLLMCCVVALAVAYLVRTFDVAVR